MANPRGAPPQALVLLDDTLFDAQCSADAQTTNTTAMLERWTEVFADGLVDDRDEDHLLYLLRHTRLEHHLNKEQCSLLRWARNHCNAAAGLVASLRARLQETKRAAGRGGQQTVATQS